MYKAADGNWYSHKESSSEYRARRSYAMPPHDFGLPSLPVIILVLFVGFHIIKVIIGLAMYILHLIWVLFIVAAAILVICGVLYLIYKYNRESLDIFFARFQFVWTMHTATACVQQKRRIKNRVRAMRLSPEDARAAMDPILQKESQAYDSLEVARQKLSGLYETLLQKQRRIRNRILAKAGACPADELAAKLARIDVRIAKTSERITLLNRKAEARRRKNDKARSDSSRRSSKEGKTSGDSENRESCRTKDERYYASVLGLNWPFGAKELKKAYRDLASAYHPDRVSHLGEKLRRLAEMEMKAINEAMSFFKLRA